MGISIENKIDIKLLVDCPEYIPYLSKLWYEQISKHWAPNASVDRARENLIKHSNRDKLPLTFVALINNQPVGMASLRENDGIQPHHTPWLGSLVVDPAYRGQKVGEQLILVVRNQASIFRYKKLYLLAFDSTIPTWYKKLGWKLIGTDQLFNHPVSVMDIDV